jgi:histidinol-phosphate aminotransferase
MSFDLNNILRKSIQALKPYSSARDEFTGKAEVYLDANENPFDTGLNRYPDPYQQELKERISHIKNVGANKIFLGNGSDEIIDLLFRAVCEPGKDEVIALPPTYGMYQVSADINDIKVNKVPLTADFEINEPALLDAINDNTKIIWFCSPNNPTGNTLDPEAITRITNSFQGIVVVDEAYIDFSSSQSWIDFLDFHPNLLVMQTFSKAWGLAGLRLGMGFASPAIIGVLNKIKPPYNINTLTQEKALEVLEHLDEKNEKVDVILEERVKLGKALAEINAVQHIYPSDANFLLVKIEGADRIYNELVEKSIIVRNRSKVELCESCLRLTVGTPKENETLIAAIQAIA